MEMVSLNEMTTDSSVGLKTGYRQTKAFFTVWQTLSFQSREYNSLIKQLLTFIQMFE